MADLIEEFFKRDLSESELDELGRLLEKEPEEALRFESRLENYYLAATGLARPHLPRSLKNLPKAGATLKTGLSGLGGWIALGTLAFASTVAVTLYHYYSSPPAAVPPPNPIPTAATPTPTAVAKKILALPPLSPSQPQKVQAGAKGDELSVVVTAPKESLVTVRILDSAGKELRLLFSGFVQPGNWAFKWDGLLPDGKTAPPGDYRIQVQSGSFQQVKDIKIKPNETSALP